MAKRLINKPSGFSTAELVVALFVAVSFILAGYTTFELASRDSGTIKNLNETHQKITNKLEEIKLSPTDYCNNPETETTDITITCQDISLNGLATSSFYEITASYPLLAENKTLKQTIYVKKS